MMTILNESKQQQIRAIHTAPQRLVIATSGGGASAIADLQQLPGASNTLLEAIVPYCRASLDQWLGAEPESYCDGRTARLMAIRAFGRAVELTSAELTESDTSDVPHRPVGIGCSASLASDRPKRGEHRAHIALQTASRTVLQTVHLTKDARSRAEEEQLVGQAILNLLAESCSVESCSIDQRILLKLPLLPDDRDETTIADAPAGCDRLLEGQADAVLIQSGEQTDGAIPGSKPLLLLPGSFRPMHVGHRRMVEVATRKLGLPVALELAITNVDKPPLDYIEIRDRLQSVGPDLPVWLTRLATFEQKSERFPGATFIVGADTIRRIADARYYAGQMEQRLAAIRRIAERDCRFLVFGRLADKRFEQLSGIKLPEILLALCQEVPESEFRADLSSTELRCLKTDEANETSSAKK